MKTKLVVQESATEPLIVAELCASCGHALSGKFCSNCGEKKVSLHDFSIKHFIEEGIEGFTHFDNKFFKSIKLLLFKPGELTKNYFQGRRVPYMKPLQLFIICNLLFFLLLTGANPFAIKFSNFHDDTPYTWFGTDKVIEKRVHAEAQFMAYNKTFNEKVNGQSKTFIVLFIPLLALGISLLYVRKHRYFTEHLVFATHFFTFVLLLFLIILWGIIFPVLLIQHTDINSFLDKLIGVISVVSIFTYFGLAVKRFYQVSMLYAIISSLLFTVIFAAALIAYRLFLFYKIFYSIH